MDIKIPNNIIITTIFIVNFFEKLLSLFFKTKIIPKKTNVTIVIKKILLFK